MGGERESERERVRDLQQAKYIVLSTAYVKRPSGIAVIALSLSLSHSFFCFSLFLRIARTHCTQIALHYLVYIQMM